MSSPPLQNPVSKEETSALALRRADADCAFHAISSGKVDAIVGGTGRIYLLQPAGEAMLPSERRLQAVIESAADVIMVLNRSGRIISQNRAAMRLFGGGPGSLIGKGFFDLVHADDLRPFYSAFINVIEEFQPDATVQFRHLQPDGSDRPIEATVSKLRAAGAAEVVVICRDLTRCRPTWQVASGREASLAGGQPLRVTPPAGN